MRSLKLLQKPQIVFKEKPEVVNLEFEHGDAPVAHAKKLKTIIILLHQELSVMLWQKK